MKNILLGIDVGTSACKVAAFDIDGVIIAQSTQHYNVYCPGSKCFEQNPVEWWEAICKAIKKVLYMGGINPAHIACIGVDGQSWAAIPIDINGKVLHNTPIWMDTRAEEICRKITEKIGYNKILQISGNPFKANYTTPKILWFKEYMPHIFNKTYKFLQSNSYIVYKLTQNISQDISQGYGLHVFNIKEGKWDEKICDEMGVPGEMLPEIYKCHQIVGEVTTQAANDTGLAKGTPVVAGGLDSACASLGAGVIYDGQTQEQGGQAGGMSICIKNPVYNPRLILSFHVIPDFWLLQGGTVGGGGTIKWFIKELGTFEEIEAKNRGVSVFKVIDEEASTIVAGSDGVIFLPYMAGERSPIWNESAKGVFFGLQYNKTRAHLVRAMLEGCAFSLQHNISTAEQSGIKINELTATGGAANSLIWTQIKSDVTGKVIKVPSSDTATALGAAILAGVGIGLYKNFEDAISKTVRIARVHYPNIELNESYKKYYEIYIEIYENLRKTMKKSHRTYFSS